MRQQLLAHEMEKARELGADLVSVLHIAPSANVDFRSVTSPDLRDIGDSPVSIWQKLVRPPDRFISVSTDQLFGSLSAELFPGAAQWLEYLAARYQWAFANSLVLA